MLPHGLSKNTATASALPNNEIKPVPLDAFKYWIHCNYCFYRFMDKTRNVFVVSCYHMLCENCLYPERMSMQAPGNIDGSTTYKCKMCLKIVRARQIGNDMPPNLKELFHPEPWSSDLPAERILKFQTKHRKHLMKAMKTVHKECIAKQHELTENIQISKKNLYEVRNIKHQNMKTERQVRSIVAARKRRKSIENYKRREAEETGTSAYSASVSSLTTSNAFHTTTMLPKHTMSVGRGRGAICHRLSRNQQTLYHSGDSLGRHSAPPNYKQLNVTGFKQTHPNNSFNL